jgi:hypothetical protein
LKAKCADKDGDQEVDMKRLILALALMLVFPIASHATIFAQLALGGGYEAVLLISNKTNYAWTGTVWVMRGYNEEWEGQWAVNGQSFTGMGGVPVALPPKGMVKLRLTGDSTTRAGYLEVSAGAGSRDVGVAISYFYEVRVKGVLQDTTGSPASAYGRRFFFAVERSSAIDTGIAWCPSPPYISNLFPMNLTLYDQNGAVARQRSYMFMGHEAQFISQLFTDLPSSFVGHLEIDSQDYIYLEVLRMEMNPSGFQLTSTPADNYSP